MPMQPPELRRNYIAILREETEEQRVGIELQKSTRDQVSKYFLGLIAATFRQRRPPS